eukprot:6321993-Pyramimonas_sp.AAC.1
MVRGTPAEWLGVPQQNGADQRLENDAATHLRIRVSIPDEVSGILSVRFPELSGARAVGGGDADAAAAAAAADADDDDDDDDVGAIPGVFKPDARDPAQAGAQSTMLWECCLLPLHWHPTVSKYATHLASMPLEGPAP